eukprot:2347926-Rhodomonas_salina.1
MGLGARYEMSGTEGAYGANRIQRRRTSLLQPPSLASLVTSPLSPPKDPVSKRMVLPVTSTDAAYGATRLASSTPPTTPYTPSSLRPPQAPLPPPFLPRTRSPRLAAAAHPPSPSPPAAATRKRMIIIGDDDDEEEEEELSDSTRNLNPTFLTIKQFSAILLRLSKKPEPPSGNLSCVFEVQVL